MTSMRLTWLAVPVLNTLFQIFMKLGATQLNRAEGATLLHDALASHWILAALVVEVVCFFVWMTILAELDLSRAFPLSGISYVLIIASGWLMFGEPIAALQVVGSGLILAGVWLIAGASEATHAVDETGSVHSLPRAHPGEDR
ncbi:EamA family transporter [Rhizobium sp. NZLR1]|uniref:EamA family transporter n=1 Tax=Rhizobium sp. NZLR1 TaxID=2731096 RepID=UPI001A998005|nr:EamA family transporter [Rhizobium sp. NZLR1]MBX5204741.1 EamA family transporter [Rhizobium sp. NZLR1]QSZ23344.1 EamA family transporter [Rhizobium sp. NZLR1]